MDDKQTQNAATSGQQQAGSDQSIGNQQGTAQTGAQNGGGENIEDGTDQYTDDLQQSGQRKSREE